MTSAIEVDGLGKRFRIGAPLAGSLREGIMRRLGRAVGRGDGAEERKQTIWALRQVSFQVQPGEVLGVVGRNGAGKSTLLKILARITEPTEGEVRIRGRVGALLEVGTGFSTELTGRENVMLNGSILGMRRRQILDAFGAIVEFAEIGSYIDTPIKYYSTGMQVRLAFAVAAHLEPEILLVDEVLAVGDFQFQRKCLGRMSDIGRGGRTVLFASHDHQAMRRLCKRTIYLEQGELQAIGPTDEVLDRYVYSEDRWVSTKVFEHPGAPVCDGIGLLRVAICRSDGSPAGRVYREEEVRIEIDYDVREPRELLSINLAIERDGIVAFVAKAADTIWRSPANGSRGRWRATCHLPPNLLNLGMYDVSVDFVVGYRSYLCCLASIVAFHVQDRAAEGGADDRSMARHVQAGVVRPDLAWEVQALPQASPEGTR